MIIHKKRPLTIKQEKYLEEFKRSSDPIKAYIYAEYVSTIEEAKKSGAYTQPLKSKAIQQALKNSHSLLTLKEREIKLEEKILRLNQKKKMINKNYVNYKKAGGVITHQFLLDIINNPFETTRDRLKALKMMMEYTGVNTLRIYNQHNKILEEERKKKTETQNKEINYKEAKNREEFIEMIIKDPRTPEIERQKAIKKLEEIQQKKEASFIN